MKSVSPLIAAVILISFTIAVSAITLPFIIKISKESTSQQEPAVKQVISCIGPDFKVYWNKVCQLKNGLVAWYTFDEGSGNITYDYSGNRNNGTYYSSGAQENSTLLQLNVNTNGTHYFFINDVDNEKLIGAYLYFIYSAVNSNTNISIYINNRYQTSVIVSSGTGSIVIGISLTYLIPNAINNITYVANDTVNITYSRLGYNFVSSQALSCRNNVCNSSWVDGKIGNALQFNGTDGCVVVPSSFPKLTGDKTIIGWINRNPNSRATVFTVDDADWGWRGYAFRIDADGTLVFRVGNGISAENKYSSLKLQANSWGFVASVYKSSSNQVIFFLNAIMDGPYNFSLSNTWNISATGAAIAGEDCLGNEVGLNGTIDEVRIYNRALSDEEIKQLYYDGLNNKFNISFTMLYTGVQAPDIGKDFTANIILSNGTSITKTFSLTNPLGVLNPLEKVNLTIDGYYPSYGLIDKVIVCSIACPGICKELPPAQC